MPPYQPPFKKVFDNAVNFAVKSRIYSNEHDVNQGEKGIKWIAIIILMRSIKSNHLLMPPTW
jgi:hypothetical protein